MKKKPGKHYVCFSVVGRKPLTTADCPSQSEHVAVRRRDGSVESLRLSFTDDRVAVRLNLSRQLVHEIEVPTCSYRMGTRNVGFGAAIIGGRVVEFPRVPLGVSQAPVWFDLKTMKSLFVNFLFSQ